jgi:hypothetical protein
VVDDDLFHPCFFIIFAVNFVLLSGKAGREKEREGGQWGEGTEESEKERAGSREREREREREAERRKTERRAKRAKTNGDRIKERMLLFFRLRSLSCSLLVVSRHPDQSP